MTLKIDFRHDVLLVIVKGDFDLVSAAEFRLKVDRAIQDLEPKNLIMDLSKVTFIDSSGLGVILGRLKQIQGRKGKLILTGVRPEVKKVLEISGIMPLLYLCPTEAMAMELLRKGAVKK